MPITKNKKGSLGGSLNSSILKWITQDSPGADP
ncbi:hypothetical protein ACVWWX_002660 [Thermostichus sp. MS-CIW-28]